MKITLSRIKNKIDWIAKGKFRKYKYITKNDGQISSSYQNNKIFDASKGNEIIYNAINNGKPVMISRFGSVELSAIYNYIQIKYKINTEWNDETKFLLINNAGFFPIENKAIELFCKEYIKCFKQIDILGVWYKPGEDIVCNQYCKSTKLVELKAIEPYYYQNPWSRILKNKKVLVIHPFAQTIKKQYDKQEFLFSDKNVLPKFDLQTLESVQSLGGNNQFKDWFEALNFMKLQINKINFDIAIIGAGAYGLPLAAYIKQIGKQAIHMGGATQILFGIKGKRWDDHEIISKLYNQYWIRPSDQEKPKTFLKVEEGCYW